MREWQLRVDEVADPTPGPGQALTKVLACGICGSDLHMLRHGAEMRATMAELVGSAPSDPMAPKPFEPQHDTIMGHEFCCEVTELGPGCDNLKVDDVVVSMPAMGSMPYMESRGKVKASGPGVFRASYGLAMGGEWDVTVRLHPEPGAPAESQYRLSTSMRGLAGCALSRPRVRDPWSAAIRPRRVRLILRQRAASSAKSSTLPQTGRSSRPCSSGRLT